MAGGGFTDISSDGPAEIVLDTQFAEPGEYVIIFDASDGSNFITFTFGDDSQNNNYFTFEELGGSITDIVELPGCVLITITVLPE